MRLTGWYSPWVLVSVAIVLMVVRRIMPLFGELAPFTAADTAYDLAGMAVSLLMALGLWFVAPGFEAAKRADEALRAAQIKAKEAETVHSTATTIAHELACPLTGILADAEMLLEHPALSADEREMLEEISSAAKEMSETLRKLEQLDQVKFRRFGRDRQVIEV